MISRDLLQVEQARALLNIPGDKFEQLIASGKLPTFRANGQVCFRREDIAAIIRERSAKTKAAASSQASAAAIKKNTQSGSKSVSTRSASRVMPALSEPTVTKRALEDDHDPAADKPAHVRRSPVPWLLGGGILVTIVIAGVSFNSARSKNSSATARESFTPLPFGTVAAPGLVEAESGLLTLAFEVSGKLTVKADEGQRVSKGELLAELESSELQARLAAVKADLNLAMAQQKTAQATLAAEEMRAQREVERLTAEVALLEAGPRQEEIARGEAEVKVAEANARQAADEALRFADPKGIRMGGWSESERDRTQRLAEAAQGQLEFARAKLKELKAGYRKEEKDKARALLGSAQTELQRTQQTRASRLEAAQAGVEQAQATVALAEAQLQKTRLLSPIDGVVVWKFRHSGETVAQLVREPVLAVADCSQLRVRADVDEADFPLIQAGQKVRVTADAFEGKFFSGVVERLGHSAGQKNFVTGDAKELVDVKIIETLIKLEMPCPLKLGLRVTAYFEAKK